LTQEKRPLVAVTIGDPAGIGPEVVLKAVQSEKVRAVARPVVVGERRLLERCAAQAQLPLPLWVDLDSPWPASAVGLFDVDVPELDLETLRPGTPSALAGRAAEAFIHSACTLIREGRVAALTTAPIDKRSLRLAGCPHIGHTELLGDFFGVSDPLTMFITENLRIFFLSRHLSLSKAIELLSGDRIQDALVHIDAALRLLGFEHPKIGLAALNPHAGDGGQFGDEELRTLAPAAMHARDRGVNVSDPIGADAIFHLALEGRFDAVLALYHDQGHIASKTRDFHGTITVTLGLPVPRTSVDHGSAMDIAWTGAANARSLELAIIEAAKMVR